MKLDGITLEDWLKNLPTDVAKKRGGDEFPYFERYAGFKHYLETNLHNEVTKQAIYQEFRNGKEIDKVIWLNDHGPRHVKTVIERATQLLSDKVELNVREVFFLLNSIQVHDIGNFYGRIDHEKSMLKAIREGLTPAVFDMTEVRYIKDIAQVHGGKIKYKGTTSLNTISSIKQEVTSNGYQIRQQFLASILRFADELADDKDRADIKSLKENRIPKGSEVYHAYAACLDTVKVDHEKQTVELHFKIPKAFLIRKFGKINPDDSITEEYLIDEIYKRAIKMHKERIYCSKFWRRFIDIEKIWVQMEFFEEPSNLAEETFDEEALYVHSDITFTLQDYDYPSLSDNIFDFCPDLTYGDGTQLTGENVLLKIQKTDA